MCKNKGAAAAAEEEEGPAENSSEAYVNTADSKLGMLYTAVARHLLARTAAAADSAAGVENDPGPNENKEGEAESTAGRPRARWSHKRKLVGRKWDLVLSEAQGQSIPWTKISG